MMKNIFTITLNLPFDEVVSRVRDVLSHEGFGVITEIDVTATFKKKLDVEFKNYLILGVCRPQLAHRVLSADDNVGLLLPCNVIVYENKDGVTVSSMYPTQMLRLLGDHAPPEINEVAKEAEKMFEKVFNSLEHA
jgi:uncharacterized protein (DUF302 family)